MSSSSDHPWIYDVFISFRGEDTRRTFVSHLNAALKNSGVNTFLDDEKLGKGEELGPELERAIEGSHISIVVLSPNYARSSWCLNELVHILHCRQTYGQVVIPIFYNVDPSHVRKQKGALGKAFELNATKKDDDQLLPKWKTALTEVVQVGRTYRQKVMPFRTQTDDFGKALELNATKKDDDQLLPKWKTALTEVVQVGRTYRQKVMPFRTQTDDFGKAFELNATKKDDDQLLSKWKSALTEVSNLSGWDLNSIIRNEAEVMKKIVEDTLTKLDPSLLSITAYPIGLESRVQQITEFIEDQSSKVCMIGIWGMGGSGKTTTAKALYNQIHRRFEGRTSFVESIREVCDNNSKGVIPLQEQLLSDLLKIEQKIHSIALGITKIRRRLKGQKAFIVLDDVTTYEQLKNLCADPKLFGSGSVLIITTRDLHLLNSLKVDHVFTMSEMDENQSLELFSSHAFRQPSPREELCELSRNVVAYCGGLPLALEVLGSYLFDRPKQEWRSTISKLKKIPNDQVQQKLRISYDGLEDYMEVESLSALIAAKTGIKQVPYSIARSKSIAYISLCGYEGLSHDVFPSLIWSWMSPTRNSLSRISPFAGNSLSLVSLDEESNNMDYQSPMLTDLSKLRCVWIQCHSESQLTQELRRFMDDLYDVNFTELETTSHGHQSTNLSLKSIVIGMGSSQIVMDTLDKSLAQGLATNSSDSFLPGDNYPSWLAYKCEGSSVLFQVPEGGSCMKGIALCVVYSSTPQNLTIECFTSVLIINYTKLTIQIYKRDTIMSFNDEDWQGVVSNLKVGDNVEIFVAIGHGLTVKETAAYLIYGQPTAVEIDIDAKSKGGPLRCDNKRNMVEASKRYEKVLNQSEDADEKGALVNDVDVNIRMADQIPYAVAESLFDRLASAAFREHGRIYDVLAELERLKKSVECIRVVLLDAQDKQEQNWITRLKDVLLLADDLLDEFIIEGTRYKVDAGGFLNQKVALKIEKIQKQFDDVLQEMAKLRLNPKPVAIKQTGSLRNKSISFLLESDITGREVDKKQIINLLRQPCGSISSIAIVGIGGIGKTTLAQFVYNDVEVQNHFEKRMWVCVSNSFDVKTIVKKMLESLIDSKIDAKLPFEYIQHTLCENLTGERYLLVLDDICNGSHKNWTQLRTYLTCGAEDSKVLMTTRSKIVSERFEGSNRVLKGLPLDVSWSMLKKITFGNETSGVNQNLESIGKKIAEKCMGVPLAVRTLGGLLQSKSEEKEWINVLQGDFWELCEDNESIMSIMKLSYQSLPLSLRQCFAYCSLFPKDWEIKKDMLIQLWIAQGYLECPDEKQLLEDVGNEFVKIFLMKSFFQDAKVDEDGDIVSFKMHDLMHDLATQVAGNDCCYMDSEAKRCVQRPMHVSLEPKAVHLLGSLDARRLRTLILLSSNEEEELNGDELSVISKFKHLRVLKLSYCSLSKLSSSIEKLKHLRYLSLSHCRGLGSLYESFSSLVLLQTLILMPIEQVKFPTKVISNLINLRHLHISNWEASRDETSFGFVKLRNWQHKGMIFSNWISSLTNIVEISFFLCGSLQYLPSMERLPFLKSLHISFLEELEYIYYEQDFPSAFFPSLECLSLQFCGKLKGWGRMGDDFNNTNCSQNLSLPPFPCLSQLSIIGCLMLTCMPTFPNLQNRLELYDSSVETMVATLNTVALESSNDFPPLSILKSLHIDGLSLNVKSIPKDWMQNLTSLQILQINWFSSQAFQEIETWFKDDLKCLPSLQKIAFHNCEDLKALPDWICNLSSLQHLGMYDCINLASLPEGIPCLTNLQTLEIIGCPLLVEDCQTQTGETWQKIGHVPKKIFSFLH